MTWNWRTGLLAQARSDYSMFLRLTELREAVEVCHLLHYLQMATEKLAKGFSNKDGLNPPEKTHIAFAGFVKNAHKYEAILRVCGFEHNEEAFRRSLEIILPVASRIEALAPRGVALNAEYPWEERLKGPGGGIQIDVRVPAHEVLWDWSAELPGFIRLLRFLEECFEAVDLELI